jgi:hypothetical protein
MKPAQLCPPFGSLLLVWVGLLPLSAARAQQPAPRPAPPVRVRAKLDGFDLSPKAGKTANQVGGASRDLGSPKLYAPGLGNAYSLHPVFSWSTAEGAEKVTFRLTAPNGEVQYEASLTANNLVYPADAPALVPGSTYRWTVIPENDMLGGAPAPVAFTIVSGAERSAIDEELKSAASPQLVFTNHRVWYDAIAAYTAALQQNPDDPAALKGRATLYDQLVVTQPLADADWQRVKQ